MMKYYYIEPEVAGGLGPNTVMDRSVHPPHVSRLHYLFDGWLGDVLLESFPCFIITEAAMRKLEAEGLTGIQSDKVEISLSEQFKELHPNQQLPPFVWLRVNGRVGQDDFGSAPDGRLVVSGPGKALEVLQSLGTSQALVTESGP
jgi:hypothetical protein